MAKQQFKTYIGNDIGEYRRTPREKGASLIEFAALVGLIAVVALTAVAYFGDKNADQFCKGAVAMQLSGQAALGDLQELNSAYLNTEHPQGPQCCWLTGLGGFGGGEVCESDL